MEGTGHYHHQHQVLPSLGTEETEPRVRIAARAFLLSPGERGVAQGSGAWLPPPTPPAEGPSHRGTGGARSRRPVAGTPGHGWRRLGCSLGHTSTGPLSPVGCR